jgi:hypothetical protein
LILTQLMGFCISSHQLDRFQRTVITVSVLSSLMLNHVSSLFDDLPEFKDYLGSFLWATYAIFFIGLSRYLKSSTCQQLWRMLEQNWAQGDTGPMNLLLSEKIILINRLCNMSCVFQMMLMINNSGFIALLENVDRSTPTQLYLNKTRYAIF